MSPPPLTFVPPPAPPGFWATLIAKAKSADPKTVALAALAVAVMAICGVRVPVAGLPEAAAGLFAASPEPTPEGP